MPTDLHLAAIAADNARAAELGPGVAYAVLLIRQLAQSTPDRQREAQIRFVADYVEREVAKF